MSQINDQAAKEATELLRCSSLVACNDDGHGGGCVYWFRPAVAERLRRIKRDWEAERKIKDQRIAALEAALKEIAYADMTRDLQRNARVLREKARAALAGRGK